MAAQKAPPTAPPKPAAPLAEALFVRQELPAEFRQQRLQGDDSESYAKSDLSNLESDCDRKRASERRKPISGAYQYSFSKAKRANMIAINELSLPLEERSENYSKSSRHLKTRMRHSSTTSSKSSTDNGASGRARASRAFGGCFQAHFHQRLC